MILLNCLLSKKLHYLTLFQAIETITDTPGHYRELRTPSHYASPHQTEEIFTFYLILYIVHRLHTKQKNRIIATAKLIKS